MAKIKRMKIENTKISQHGNFPMYAWYMYGNALTEANNLVGKCTGQGNFNCEGRRKSKTLCIWAAQLLIKPCSFMVKEDDPILLAMTLIYLYLKLPWQSKMEAILKSCIHDYRKRVNFSMYCFLQNLNRTKLHTLHGILTAVANCT